jgi:hypothetical protein
MDSEDDNIGSGSFFTTKEANFGIGENPSYYTFEGCPNENNLDWGVIGLIADVETYLGDVCRAAAEFFTDAFLIQGESRIRSRGGNWIDVTYHPTVLDTRMVDRVKVKFVGAKVVNDRDGRWRGDGDIYGRTLVGVVGGEASNSNSYSLSGDVLNQLPYSAADVHRFGCGDVGSGSSFTKNRFIFDRSFSNPNMALLYIQIALWDDDGSVVAHDEVGVLSIAWPMVRLFDVIENPDGRHRYGEGIEVSSTPDGFYVIRDTREVWTRNYYKNYFGEKELWGYPGARITYEIWIDPGD